MVMAALVVIRKQSSDSTLMGGARYHREGTTPPPGLRTLSRKGKQTKWGKNRAGDVSVWRAVSRHVWDTRFDSCYYKISKIQPPDQLTQVGPGLRLHTRTWAWLPIKTVVLRLSVQSQQVTTSGCGVSERGLSYLALWLGTCGEREEPFVVAWENYSGYFMAFVALPGWQGCYERRQGRRHSLFAAAVWKPKAA